MNLGTARNRANTSRGGFADIINELVQRGQTAVDAPGLTARDLFGDQLTRIEDSARQNANATKSAISRSLMSGGGDVTGAAGTQLLNVGQGTEQSIGKANLDFAQLADRINRQNEGQGYNLLSQGLQGSQNLATFDQRILDEIINRELMKEQAEKQRRTDLIGAGLGVLSGGVSGFLAGR